MTRLIVLVYLLMSSLALAGTPLEPPARYNHEYNGALTIILVNDDNVYAQCSIYDKSIRKDAAGCAFAGDGECTIYLAMLTKRAPVQDILEHEIAHCNGWSPRHESRNSSRDNRRLYAYLWFTIHHRLS